MATQRKARDTERLRSLCRERFPIPRGQALGRECRGRALRRRRFRAVRVLVYDRHIRMRTPAVQTLPRMPPQQQRAISRGGDFLDVQDGRTV